MNSRISTNLLILSICRSTYIQKLKSLFKASIPEARYYGGLLIGAPWVSVGTQPAGRKPE
jgi:hypothetical protein